MTAFVRSCACSVAVGLLLGAAAAQTFESARDGKLIARVKSTLVSQLEAGMPRITLEYFLRSEAGQDAELIWEVNDCGEQTGNPADSGRDIPICVQADATQADGLVVSVMVAVGSVKTGTDVAPKLFSVFVNGARKSISRLSEIPAELHRDFPRKPKTRDLPKLPSVPGAM